MLLGVRLAGVGGVLGGVVRVRGRGVGVVGGLLVVARLVVLGGFGVVFGGRGVVDGGLLVALGGFLRHNVGILGCPNGGARAVIRLGVAEVVRAGTKKTTRPWGRLRQYRGQAGVGLSYVEV